jgi:Na+/melibiose symporter-like transporter
MKPAAPHQAASPPRLPNAQLAAYGALAMPFSLMQGPGLAILPNMYAESFGIALTQVSLALLISRLLCEALGSLLVGVLSDHTRSRFGRRKPWVVAGAMLGVFGVMQLYVPSGRPDAWHMALWLSFVYLAWNMFDVPYTAWGNELSHQYEDRARVAVWRQGFSLAGVLVLAWLPLVVSPTHEIDWGVLRWVAMISVVLLPLAVAHALRVVPQEMHLQRQARLTWRQAIKTVAGNRPFAVFLAFTVMVQVAVGMSSALFFLYFSTYLGLGSWFPLFATTTTAVSLLAIPLWMRLIRRTSKNRMLVLASCGFVFTLPLVHGMSPGPGALLIYMAYDALWGLCYGGIETASRAMLGDIVDYDTLKTRRERTGEYVALWSLVVKGTQALAASLAFAVAGWYGYDAAAKSNDADAIFGLNLSQGGLPMMFALGGLALAWIMPMTRRRHDTVRRRLERRMVRQAV